jgi:uncharacterized membrane protein YidH (DUF202 family)
VIKTTIQWLSVLFELFAATGSGILAFVGISEFVGSGGLGFDGLRSKAHLGATVVALALVVFGGLLYVARLGNPTQVMAITRNVSSGSPASWEFLIYLLVLVCAVICLLVLRREGRLGGVLSALCILLALAMGCSTGYYHMAMIGTPAWHSPAIPLGFTAGALLVSGFIYLAVAGCGLEKGLEKDAKKSSEEDSKASTSKIMVWILAVLAIATTAAALFFGASASFGQDALLYWIAAPAVGGVSFAVAIVMLKCARGVSRRWAFIGASFSLIGALAFRASLWLVDSTIPTLFRG